MERQLVRLLKTAAVGLVLSALSAGGGCVSLPEVSVDAEDPSVVVKADGIYFGETLVRPQDVAPILERAEIPRTRTIHILLDPSVKNLMPARTLMGLLAKAGYTRPVLVTKRHAASERVDAAEAARRRRAARAPVQAPSAKSASRRRVRYKGANE